MKIENTAIQDINEIVASQREFFASNATLSFKFRKEQLKKLNDALKEWEKPLCDALWKDLHKSAEEAILTELSIVAGEVKNHIKHLQINAADLLFLHLEYFLWYEPFFFYTTMFHKVQTYSMGTIIIPGI